MALWKYHPQIPAEFPIPDKDLIQLFYDSFEKRKNLPFLIFEGKKKSYTQAEFEMRKLANSFAALGLSKGDRVALLMPNCPQYVISYLSSLYLGCIITAISPLYTANEIQFQLKDSGAKVIVTLDMYLDKIRSIRETTNLKHVVATSVADELPTIKGLLYRKVIGRKNPKISSNELKYTELIKNGSTKNIKAKIDPKNDVACLQYTGGTTGVPKAAMLTHRNLASQAITINYWEWWVGGPRKDQGRSIGALPFSHIFGLTTSFFWPMYNGSRIVLIPDPRKLVGIMKAVQKHKIHFFMGVPVLFQKLAEHPKITKYNFSSIRGCIAGGSSLHWEILKSFEEKTKALLVEGYGLTEASPVTHVNPADPNIRQKGIGIPIPNTQVKIIDLVSGEDITEFEPNSNVTLEGELLIKGPQVMKGYWNKPEETEKVLLNDGWLKTGDVVRMNKEGFFTIVDRLKDCINTSGMKVWPLEIESVLCNHPDISMAAAIPVKDTNLNEVVKAVIVAKPGSPQHTTEELRDYCKQFLANYKIPKIIEYRKELPLSPVGKVLRRPLREESTKAAIKVKNV